MSDLAKEFVAFARDRLSSLPYADETGEKTPIEDLAAAFSKFSPLDILRWEGALSDPIYRALALDFLVHTQRTDDTTEWAGGEHKGQTLVTGDLRVTGNLRNCGNLVVLGNLEINGAYLAFSSGYPCLNVGGNFGVASAFLQETETLCLGVMHVNATLIALRNHTVTMAKSIQARVVISEDAHLSATVESPRHMINPGYDVELYSELYGVEAFDEDDPDFDSWDTIYDVVIASMLA